MKEREREKLTVMNMGVRVVQRHCDNGRKVVRRRLFNTRETYREEPPRREKRGIGRKGRGRKGRGWGARENKG